MGEHPYTYPVVQAEAWYLWAVETEWHYGYDHWYYQPWYEPWYHYNRPYRYPYRYRR